MNFWAGCETAVVQRWRVSVMTHNIILNADSYKASHYLQYPPDTRYVSSYIESRGGVFEKTLFFGLHYHSL